MLQGRVLLSCGASDANEGGSMIRLAKVALVLVVILALAALYVFNPRLPVPEGAASATLYEPGPLDVTREAIALLDTSRPTPANGDFPGSAARELNGYLWTPARRDAKPFPLIVYSHGFMSSVAEPEYLVEFLVPKGYAVVAVNYPLSNGNAPGGATINDVLNQPGDVSFVIDAMLARSADAGDPLHGLLDPSRIAAVGLSLGGLTTQLAAYHRDLRDPRLRAAVSIAGPSAQLERRFFETADLPFMMIAGSTDAIVPYEENAAPIPTKAANSLLVTLDRGSHVGFASVATTVFRWADHPDSLACPMLLRNLRNGRAEDAPRGLAPDAGLGIVAAGATPCAMERFDRAMRPGQQQMLTRLALYAFLEQAFASDPERRREMAGFLTTGLAAENAGVAVTGHSPAAGAR
jgi:predicted dienelactone hydrolase